jgi:hypothetical protein
MWSEMTIFEAVFAPNDATMQSFESRMFRQGYRAPPPSGRSFCAAYFQAADELPVA